jgi:putative transposase
MIHECRTIAAIRVPGGTYFFTVNLLERRSDLLVQHIQSLRAAMMHTRSQRTFPIDAWVVLPAHALRHHAAINR